MATRPLRPIKVPESLTADHVLEVLKRSRGDYSSENIRSSIQKMIDAGKVDKSIAGHLAMASVYAGDRIEGIGAGQAVLGGVKPTDERYFEGSPQELAAMRRKRTGARQEFQTSVPAEYQPIIKAVFDSPAGRKAVARALRVRMEEGKIPTNERAIEKYGEAIKNVRFAKPTATAGVTLGLKPADADKDPVLGPAPGRQAARTESRLMSTEAGESKTSVKKGAKLVSLGARASETARKQARKEKAFKVLRTREENIGGRRGSRKVAVVGPPRSKYAIEQEAKQKEREASEDVEFGRGKRTRPRQLALEPRVVGKPGEKRELVGPLRLAKDVARPRPTVSGKPEPTDKPAPRRLPIVRRRGRQESVKVSTPRNSRVRPTVEGVLSRIAARAEPPVKQDTPPYSPGLMQTLMGGRLGGAQENVVVPPPARKKQGKKVRLPKARLVQAGSFRKVGKATRKPIIKRPGKGPGMKEQAFAMLAKRFGR